MLQATVSFSESTLGDIVIVSVSGELDVSNKAQAKAALADVLAKASVGYIVDLQKVSYLDSTAVVLLIMTQRQASQAGIPIAVVIDEGSNLGKLFQITGLDKTVDVCFTLEAARRVIIGSASPGPPGKQKIQPAERSYESIRIVVIDSPDAP
jgi:anti-sigma B factor antagonist